MNSEEDGGTKRNRSFAASIVFRTNLKLEAASSSETLIPIYRGADKSFARTGRKQARKHVRDVRDFNNIETRAVIKFFFFFLQGKAPKEIHAIVTEILACFLPSRVKELSAPLYNCTRAIT